MRKVRLTQIDGPLPNLALMKLAHWHRFNRMTERGIRPFPMVYDRKRTDLIAFQRWACRGLYRVVPWNEYVRETKSIESVEAFERSVAPGLLLNQNFA